MSNILTKEFKDKVESDLKINDLQTENYANISKQHYYLQILIEHRIVLSKIESERNNIYKELFHYYKYEQNFELKVGEIELYIKADKKFKDIERLYKQKLIEIEYLEEVVALFKNRGFHIKNAVDLEKLKS